MVAKFLPYRRKLWMWRPAALGRTDLVHVFGCQDGDHEARPVCDGVAKESSPMCYGSDAPIQDNPDQKNAAGNEAKGMTMKEAMLGIPRHGFDDIGARELLSYRTTTSKT